jgi:hypothetical protein
VQQTVAHQILESTDLKEDLLHIIKPADEVHKLLQSIPHSSCTNAIDRYWKVDHDGRVRAQSVLWLFCWAKTGMNSERARIRSEEVLNTVLPTTFKELDAALDHAYARRARYSSLDMEEEFESMTKS